MRQSCESTTRTFASDCQILVGNGSSATTNFNLNSNWLTGSNLIDVFNMPSATYTSAANINLSSIN